MISEVEAIYENGVFKPLEPVDWSEKQKVRVTMETDEETGDISRFVISAERWQQFCDLLDAPPKVIPALRKLLTEKSVLDGGD
jgi:predicted DNA-binding antitoxin AbrB/MazE fold protein